jgi:hypothetical protein
MREEAGRPTRLTGHAFVTFTRPETRARFIDDFGREGSRARRRVRQTPQTVAHARDLGLDAWVVSRAADETDIRWECMRYSSGERKLRVAFSAVASTLVLSFFTTPVTILNTVHNLVADSDIGSAAGSAADAGNGGERALQELARLGEAWPEVVRTTVFDFAPSLMLVLLLYGVLALLEIPAQVRAASPRWPLSMVAAPRRRGAERPPPSPPPAPPARPSRSTTCTPTASARSPGRHSCCCCSTS